jgi:hypothetical protein
MESMWNMLVPSEYLHGIHVECIYSMDSIWNIFHYINKVFIHMDSTWNEYRIIPHGFHVDSMWIPLETQLQVKFSSQVDNFNLIQKV